MCADFTLTICGRSLTIDDVELIRRIIASDPTATREWISREVCQAWSWFKPDGGLKNMSCKVLLLRLHRSGMIALPAPRRSNANGQKFSRRTEHGEPGKEISGPLKSLLPIKDTNTGKYQLLSTEELNNWINQKKDMIIVDTMNSCLAGGQLSS